MTDLEIKENQALTLQLFDAFLDICDRHGIKYYIGEGSAIGAVREKGFIPWDINLDVNMVYEEYLKLDAVMETETPEGMEWSIPPGSGRMVKRLVFPESAFEKKPPVRPNIDVGLFAPTSNLKAIRYIDLVILHLNYSAYKLRQSKVKRAFPYNFLRGVAKIFPPRFYFAVLHFYEKRYNPEKSGYLINLLCAGKFHVGDIVKKEWFTGEPEVFGEFEGRRVRLPHDYDTYLRRYYGDYMTPKRANKGHSRHQKKA